MSKDIARALSYKRGYRVNEAIDIINDVISIMKHILLEGNALYLDNFFSMQVLRRKQGNSLVVKKSIIFGDEIKAKQAEGVQFEIKQSRRNQY
jgi:nucleoid DNA-binding protein